MDDNTIQGKASTSLLAGACLAIAWLASPPALAGFDAPGTLIFDFYSEPQEVFDNWADVPQDTIEMEARAFFSSNASAFGDNGVFIWAGFEFYDDWDPRAGILLLDIDLSRAPLDGETPVPYRAVRAEYIEKWGDQIYFEGQVALGDVWLVDVFFHEDDKGALEGDLALVFYDPSGDFPGCRVLVRGRFMTNPSPATLRGKLNIPEGEDGVVYVDTSCSGNLYVSDQGAEGCDCGGEDPDAGGCEGDTDSGGDCSGCEGDSGGGDCSGCSGDTGGGNCSGSAGGSCSGASGAGSCGAGGAATCSTRGPRLRPGRTGARGALAAVVRFLPELFVLGFIVWMKRRNARRPA